MTAYLRVAIGGERYGVAIDAVREVAELGDLVAMPGAGPHLAGVRHLHGELLPVVRLNGLLGAPEAVAQRVVVVEDGDRRAGLAVDAAEEVEQMPTAEPTDAPMTTGSVLHEGRMIGLLDVTAVLDAVAETLA